MDYTQIDLLQKETITYPLSYPVPCYLGVDDYYARYIKKNGDMNNNLNLKCLT